tara:strand:- start:261 stop:641 length:381 start_codon:yes stop_codon:yes gene_type:complete
MNIDTYLPLIKFLIFVVLYEIFLILFSPIIDHSFTTLDQDKLLKETNTEILVEIMTHIIVLTIVFLCLDKGIQIVIKGIGAKNYSAYKTAAELLTAVTLIGLQKNLIDKLNYITHEHPFREVKVEE